MEYPEEGRVRHAVDGDDQVLAIRNAACIPGFPTWNRLCSKSHLIVDRQHATDKKAVDNYDYDVLLGKHRVRQGVDGTIALVLIIPFSESGRTSLESHRHGQHDQDDLSPLIELASVLYEHVADGCEENQDVHA